MVNSSRRRAGAKSQPAAKKTRTRKPKKPAFPLWLHSTGQWGKRIKGRYCYFGTDKDAALKEYLRVKDDLEAGRTPPPADSKQTTLLYLTNAFLTHQKHKVKTGELALRSFDDYYSSCEIMLRYLGKTTVVEQIRPGDLLAYRQKLAETRNATSVGNEVNRTRVVLRFAFEAGLIDRPIRMGQFKRPSKAVMRRQRAAKGSRMFEPHDLRKLLDVANLQVRAMILLGVNCGFGNSDCALLPMGAVDLQAGWIDYPRRKTGIPRRCPLWKETIEALQAVLDKRKTPHREKDADILFVTQRAECWASESKGATGITHEFRKLLDRLDLYRPGLSFYALRHVHQTIGDETGDYLAVRRIMGHADSTISDAYRERFPDDRLVKVVEHVRQWLFGTEGVSDG